MSTVAILFIVVGVLAVGALLLALLRSARLEREIERQRLDSEAAAYRERAGSSISRARELGSEAEFHRQKAVEHAELADHHADAADRHADLAAKAEEQAAKAGEKASTDGAEAAERERKIA
jgi:Tfp pilus assembly protein PilV